MINSFNLTEKQSKVLEKARGYFEYADRHPITALFRKKATEDFSFADGSKQWPEDILAQLAERGQSPITINKVRNIINHMSGMEIQTRFKVTYNSQSGNVDDDRLANALTHLAYAIDENQDISYKSSLKFRDALITGIGWSNLYKDPISGEIKYEHVHPMNILFDPDNLDDDLVGMNFVARVRWISLAEAEELWPKHKAYFNSYFSKSGNMDAGNYSGEIQARQQGFIDLYSAGSGTSSSRIMVVEVQYKESKKAYQGVDSQGHHFKTFDQDKAQEISDGGEIKEVIAPMVMRTLFTGDALLEYAPLNPSIPDLPDFTYIPCVISRYQDGQPDGILSDLKDIQRAYNYGRTKLANNLNSFKAVIDADAFPGKSPEEIRNEIKRPDSVLIKTPGSVLDIESNQSLASGQFELLARADIEMQQVSGIYDDALGKQTNAESGVAIQRRQINSVRNQVFAFDHFRISKRREARMKLHLIQGGGDEFMEVSILKPEEKEVILLNVVREFNGKKVVLNDVRHLPLSISLKEVPDFESSLQEEQATLEKLLNNPNASLIFQNQALLKRLGVSDYEELSREMQQSSQNEMQQQAMAKEQAIAMNNQPRGE